MTTPIKQNPLGFFYMLFQPYPDRDRVKAWIDGADEYVYIRIEEMLSFAEKLSYDMRCQMYKACMETSMFFWQIEEEIVERVTLREKQLPYKLEVELARKREAAAQDADIVEKYWRSDVAIDPNGKPPKVNVG